MKNIKPQSKLNKQDRKGILYLILLLSAIQLFILFYTPPIKQSKTTELEKKQIRQWQKSIDNKQRNKKIKPFNPNNLKEKEWMKLGFSKKQAQVILKYKRSLGKFSTLAQIKKCFVISDDKFKEIQPYILLEDKQQKNTVGNIDDREISNDKKISPFNPNNLKEKEWMKLGFSKKQAQVILKYKRSLGRFSTLAQIKKCFVISDDKFKEIQPYILLEDKQQKNTAYNIDDNKISNDLNSCDINALVATGIKRRDARRIFNYRKALGGFYNFNQLKEIHLSAEKIALLRKKTVLKTSINWLNINSTPLYILRKHPYISQNFAAFLKSSREKGIKFSSIEHLQKQYKRKITKKLMVYLSF